MSPVERPSPSGRPDWLLRLRRRGAGVSSWASGGAPLAPAAEVSDHRPGWQVNGLVSVRSFRLGPSVRQRERGGFKPGSFCMSAPSVTHGGAPG